ncbi:phosphopantothenoylcysteine decarboxylase subunit VHS3-like, partial [Clarias magur]
GSVMFWGCFAASGTGCLESVQGTMKSQDYQGILERNVLASVRKLGLSRRSWVLQQDNDPKHTAKNTQEWLRGKHWTILKWPSMSPDLNPIEHLWKELKHAVWKRHPSNQKQLEQLAHEEWAKIPAEKCRSLIDSYRNRLIAVIPSK